MGKQWETNGLDQSQFHSSRSERHEMGGISKNKKRLGFFQRNPSFKILIIDLIFIAIISGVIVPFIMKREGVSNLEDYKLTLKAFNFDDTVMVSLTVKDTEGIDSAGLVEASFYFEEDLQEFIESDLLPSDGDERVLKRGIPENDSKYIYCNVTINGNNKTIKKKIK